MKLGKKYSSWLGKKNLIFSTYLGYHCKSIASFLGLPEELVCSSEPAQNFKKYVLSSK